MALYAAAALLTCGLSVPAASSEGEAVTVCTRHLQAIGNAMHAYQRNHGELPHHLSDLYPNYVADRHVLHCPADGSTSSSRSGGRAESQPSVSYAYEMNTDRAPEMGVQLGPSPLETNASLRERKMAQRVNFGDRVPAVRCYHHEGVVLNLTLSGQVYRSQRVWEVEPATIDVVLRRMDEDLAAGPAQFVHRWVPGAIEDYATQWFDAPLPPALRYRLGAVADRLFRSTEALPAASRSDAYRLAARFYRAAGQRRKALASCEGSLRHGRSDPSAASLLADLQWGLNGRTDAPPVDAYLKAEMARRHIPGLSTAVVHDGKVVEARGYGLANVELSVGATAHTVYQLASVTKPFTASAIMMLVEEGKLALDDKITQYLPELPTAWSRVTLRHLLTHTSGIPDYLNDLPSNPVQQDTTPEEIIKKVRGLPLKFDPGEHYAYCNTGYTLLGLIIEKVSGKPYGEFLSERIFQPLQMHATRLNDRKELVRNRASGYSWNDGALRNANYTSPTWFYAAGGLISTVSDVAKWIAALSSGKLLKQSSLQQMWIPAKLNNGTPVGYGFGYPYYGFGWGVGSYHGRTVVGHAGGMSGFSTHVSHFVDDKVSAIVLTNCDFVDTGPLAKGVARYYLSAPRQIEDRDVSTTQKLNSVLVHLTKGKADSAMFTPSAYSTFLPGETSAFYRSLGTVRLFYPIEQTSDGEQRTYRYWAGFTDTGWIQTFVLTAEGKIADLGVEPE